MRIRSIKPDFYKDDELAERPPLTRLLFSGLWGLADCEGRLKDNPKRIKVEVLPYDECDIDEMLTSLAPKFIKRYGFNGQRFIEIVNFKKHQRISGKEASLQSEIPAFDAVGSNGEATGKHLGNNGEGAVALEGKGREGNIYTNGPQKGASGKKVEKTNGNRPYILKTPGQEVIGAYKFLRGVRIEDREWDQLYYPRFKKSAEQLLKFLGSVDACLSCMEAIKKWAESNNLDWTLETVVKRASDWRTKTLWKAK